jgi:putative hydrolase of the HAD superfamily
MNAVLVFDADNTLWDTDSVFRSAQLALLKTLEKFHLLIDSETQLATLRMIDRELFKQIGRFEYNFKLLSVAVAYHFAYQLSVQNVQEGVSHAISDSRHKIDSKLVTVIDEAYWAFEKELQEIPKLYLDTETILFDIFASKQNNLLTTILLSEGEPERLNRILKKYENIKNLFDNILIEQTKTKETIEKAKQAGREYLSQVESSAETLFVLIGDSLKRDIKFGNQAGFITVYKPSPFMGQEEPQLLDEKPNYIIQKLGDLPLLLNNLGLYVEV